CRDLLDYEYYAAKDRSLAGTLPLKDSAPQGKIAAQVLRLALQRDPTDAAARQLLGKLHEQEGRPTDAKIELRAVSRLRSGYSPTPTPAGRPSASAPAPAPNSSRDVLAQALSTAVLGDADGALRYFTAANFPQEKPENAVREAYIEV